jgi:hypothetical protein
LYDKARQGILEDMMFRRSSQRSGHVSPSWMLPEDATNGAKAVSC